MTTVSPFTKELDNKGTVEITYRSPRTGKLRKESVGEPGLVSWKDCWDSLFNEPSFRSFYLGGYLYEYVIPVDFAPSPEDRVLRSFSLEKTNLKAFIKKHQRYVDFQRKNFKKFNTTKPKGSILIKGGGKEDHYVSFRIKGDILKVFDPADTSGSYDAYFPKRYQKLLSLITGKRVVVSQNHPQCTKGDTFCQTWTIARLNSNLKQFTKYKPQSRSSVKTRLTSSVQLMSNIVYRITHNTKFENYLKKPTVHSKFKKIFDKSRSYYKLPPALDSVDYFIELSRRIQPRHIESIFKGD